ncbi:unnamed protein product [Knipowitschia caucasica]
MAHSCRWRFPARPGGSSNSGTGRKAGRIRVTASLQSVSGAHQNAAGLGPGFDAALQVSSVITSNLQIFRDVLGESNDSSSGEDEEFGGFGSITEQKRVHSPSTASSDTPIQERKPRGRPPRVVSTQKSSSPSTSSRSSPTQTQPEALEKPVQKVKRLPGRPPGASEKRRGRPRLNNKKSWGSDDRYTETELDTEEEDGKKEKSNDTDAKLSRAGNSKRLRETKLSPLKSRLKTCVPRRRRGRPPSAERLKAEAGSKRGNSASLLRNDDGSNDQDSSNAPASPSPSTPSRLTGLRKSPRHRTPVRIVPSSKRTDATIAKQLLQRAKKGAQKRLEKGASTGSGVSSIDVGIRKTQVKNIRQFIMPVVSTVSLRIIKTPKRFIEDEGGFGTPQMKMPRLETSSSTMVTCTQPTTVVSSPSPVPVSSTTVVNTVTIATESLPPPPTPTIVATIPSESKNVNNDTNDTTNGRFSSAASCGSSAVSQHSSQLSSAESSRSSSPSLEDSTCESQGSDGTQALSEPEDNSLSLQEQRETNEMLDSRPVSPPSEPEPGHCLMERNKHGHRGQEVGRGSQSQRVRENLPTVPKKPIISPPTGVLLSSSAHVNVQQASSTASSSSSPPPPPLLSPPQLPPSVSNAAAVTDHHAQSPWISHSIPPFCAGASVLSGLADKRSRSILREPTFRWTSLSHPEQKCFSSAKYAKEGLIRKPIFDNFRPPPLTPEDVGIIPQSGTGGVTPVTFPVPSSGGGSKTLFGPLQPHVHTQQSSSSRFDAPLQKRSPLLRAPRFTPSEAHSRIFESVTLQSSSGSSPGSLSPQQSSTSSSRTIRRKRRLISGTHRGHLRSPSHSMTRRSSQMGRQTSRGKNIEKSLSSNNPSSIPGVSASPLTASALTPFSTFTTMTMGLGAQATPDSRRGAALNIPLSSSSPLFPIFPSAIQDQVRGVKSSKERTVPQDSSVKEKDLDKIREKEKENRESRRDLEKRGKVLSRDCSPSTPSSHFSVDGKDSEVVALSSKKPLGRKKSATIDITSDPVPTENRMVQSNMQTAVGKGSFSKKGRQSERGAEVEIEEKEKQNGSNQATTLSGQSNRQLPISSVLAQAEKQPVTDKRVVGLLKKAKAQLFKIEKSKMKLAEPTKVLGQESDSSETSVRGPRIKHVCRRAAVALGRNRAVFPDDMPTLSALPWEEREKILSSMGNDDKSSVAGSEEAEPQSPPIKPRETRHKPIQDAPPKKGRRSRRCGQCSGCQVPEDCGECTNCLDKPKFGGRNIKKQCCKMRKCQNLQWMPSKILLKQGKGKKEKRRNKVSEKKDSANTVKESNAESTMKPTPSSPKEESLGKKSATPPLKLSEDKLRQPSEQPSPLTTCSLPVDSSEPSAVSEVKQLTSVSSKKGHKDIQSETCSSSSSTSSSSSSSSAQSSPVKTSVLHLAQQKNWPTVNQTLSKKESPKSDPRKSLQESPILPSSITPDSDLKRTKSSISWPDLSKQRPKDKALTTKPHHSSNLNWLSTPSTRGPAKSRATCDGVHRIRVDLKRDHDVDKVWDVGGLSLLTSGPVTPRVLCLLCASSGNVEFVYCQVCCEPFHLFCLGESERPHQEQFENWCCRRCRFCQACGRKHHKNKQPLLECDKCRNSYHPECLGTNYPSRPTKKKKIWVCSNCVCCKSCGATKPGKSWNAQWSHDFSMCQECAKVSFKGKLCLLCNKCYDEDDDCGRRMMQCGHCKFWVHAKCEKLTDEMYELLPNLPESVAFTCTKCTDCCPSLWRTELERNLQSCIRTVLNALLNSHTSMHLLRFRQQSVKPPELNPETEERQPSRRSPEGPDPPVLMEATSEPSDSPQDLESVEKKMDLGCYKSVMEFGDDIARIIQTSIHSSGGQLESRKANGMVKAFFIRQMDRIFPWIKVKESRFWERQKVSASVLLPNAVLPPSLDHNYAQWQERQELSRAVQPLFTKKIIPAPSPQSQSGPDPASSPSVHPSLIRPLPLSPGDEDSPDSPVPPGIGDNRQCALCLKYGDENNNEGGRLLYIGQNEWTHINCALWSSDVFEDDNGSLKNVHLAVLRGKEMSCEKCQRPGATVSCCLTSCSNNYHFMCARQCQCIFLEDKKVYCSKHRDLIKGHAVSGFAVTRRVLVDIESMSLKKKWLSGLEPDDIHMIIGSMTIDCLGKLTELSDCKRKLFPVGYQCSRVYWSTIDARKRCVYTCRILVCHSAVSECDLRSTMAPEHNLTIAHSPSPVADFPDPFESPRRSDTLSPSCAPKLRVYTRNRHPSYPPAGPRPLISSGGTSQIQSHPVVTAGHSLPNPSVKNVDSRRHSSPSLSPPQPLIRQRGIVSSHIISRPLTSPPPLIPSPARDPERAKHSGKESSNRDEEKSSLFSTEKNRWQHTREQSHKDTNKERVRVLSRDHVFKDTHKNKSKDIQLKDRGQVSAKELEQHKCLTKELRQKDTDRGRTVNRDHFRDSDKDRQVTKSAEKVAQPSTVSTNRGTEKNKTSSRAQSVDKNAFPKRDKGLGDSHKHRQHSRESGKDSSQGKERSNRDSDKCRPHSRDSNHRSTERYKDSGKEHGSPFVSAGEIRSSRLTSAGQGQSSPPAGTAVVTGQHNNKNDRHEKHRSNDQQLSSTPSSRHKPLSSPDFAQLKDKSNSGKGSTSGSGNISVTAVQKNTGKSGSPSFQKSSSQKSNDSIQSPIPSTALKPLWLSKAAADDDTSKQSSSKQPKVKRSSSREQPKDQIGKSQTSGTDAYSIINNTNSKITGSTKADTHKFNKNGKPQVTQNHTKGQSKTQDLKEDKSFSKSRQMLTESDKMIIPDNSNKIGQTSLTVEKLQPKHNTNNQLSVRDKSSASIPSDPNSTNTLDGISPSCHSTVTASSVLPPGQGGGREIHFSSPSANSDSSESDTQPHAAEVSLPRGYSQGLLAEDDPEGQDDDHQSLDDKHHDDDSDGSGSAKRRYPRRSARARSNMFFGLTPFYGVRSYGEEDLHFYGSEEVAGSMVKKRSGVRKKSAEGQVDGADDISSSSSSGDSGEDDGSHNPYYYNFTRTIINPGEGLPSIEGIDQCLGQESQLQRFLKDEEQQKRQADTEEDLLSELSLGQQHIGQLDGVDDGSESDTSISTTSTTNTIATSTPPKNTPKRRTRERHSDKMDSHPSNKDSDNSGGPGGGNTREGRKHQKENCLPHVGKSQAQSQDPLDAQLSLSTDLLKSDSDNNNSDDCGNILPSDIMEFVLNTPSLSMQTLGQQAESSSSELLLDEGFVGVDVNRRKDILFDDFSQPLSSSESGSGSGVESNVNNSMSVEEPYLPLELPSDLSVLTTRSPTVSASQNHTAGSLIADPSDRSMLNLTTDSETIRGRKISHKKREENQHNTTSLGNQDVTEGHMTPEQFIPSPAIGQAVETTVNPDVPRAAGTPSLPSSPSISLKGQKFLPVTCSPSPVTVTGPPQVSSPAVIKTGPDKLIVVNQQFQPLYVLQTVPNGVTQKISATGVMETGSPAVLSSMTLTTGLNTSLTPGQQIFPATGKVLSTVAHPTQIHTFTGATQTGFSTGIPSTTSGLLIGLSSQPQDQSQFLVSEAGRPREFCPNLTIVSSPSTITSSSILPSGHGKKRPISRLQPRKSKKLSRSRSQPSLARADVGPPNMTLINFSSSQITSIQGQPTGLVEVNALSASQRKVPNIIKRPKPGGVMYLDPTSLLQQRIASTQSGIIGHDSSGHLLPCTVSSLTPSQSVLNVVSVPPSGVLGPGVSLSTPVLSSSGITGPISSLLFKAGPHGLGLSDQPVVLQPGGGPINVPVQTSIASSLCVLPSHQSISMSKGETEGGTVQYNKTQTLESGQNAVSLNQASAAHFNPKRQVVGVFTRTQTLSPSQSSRTTPISRSYELKQSHPCTIAPATGGEKGKTKAKRSLQNPEVVGGKKHKAYQEHYNRPSATPSVKANSSSKVSCSSEPMDTGKPTDKSTNHGKKKTSECPGKIVGKGKVSHAKRAGSLIVSSAPGQEDNAKDSALDSKPKKGIIFEISSEDGFHIRCESIEEAWKSLTDKVQEARFHAHLKELSFDGVNALRMLGIVHEAVVFLLEQLSGSRHCRSYRFRFHKPEESDEPPVNPHGSARAEIHNRRSVFDVFNFLASKHRQPPAYRPQDEEEEEGQLRVARRAFMELPLTVRFKQIKTTCKETVGVYRSPIHGRGLFCKKTIDAGEMVIEYSGNVIRSVLTDKREKYYDGKGIGCYMFRIDDFEVVDATVHGNAARFINHSCEPNCYSRVITVDGQKHIVIFALRRIYCGEELTYDYKFPIEDASSKLPCNCGAKKCRSFLN